MDTSETAIAGAGILFMLVFLLVVFLFIGYCFKRIAEKAGDTDTGLWWIPIVNYLLILRVADKPAWWLVLLLIPLVNVVVSFIVWIEVSERLGHGTAWGVIAVLVSIIGIPYLAFSEPRTEPMTA